MALVASGQQRANFFGIYATIPHHAICWSLFGRVPENAHINIAANLADMDMVEISSEIANERVGFLPFRQAWYPLACSMLLGCYVSVQCFETALLYGCMSRVENRLCTLGFD